MTGGVNAYIKTDVKIAVLVMSARGCYGQQLTTINIHYWFLENYF